MTPEQTMYNLTVDATIKLVNDKLEEYIPDEPTDKDYTYLFDFVHTLTEDLKATKYK